MNRRTPLPDPFSSCLPSVHPALLQNPEFCSQTLPSSYLEGQQAPITSRGKKSFGLWGLQGKSEHATAVALLEHLAQEYSRVRGHHSSVTPSQGSLTNHPAGKTHVSSGTPVILGALLLSHSGFLMSQQIAHRSSSSAQPTALSPSTDLSTGFPNSREH